MSDQVLLENYTLFYGIYRIFRKVFDDDSMNEKFGPDDSNVIGTMRMLENQKKSPIDRAKIKIFEIMIESF